MPRPFFQKLILPSTIRDKRLREKGLSKLSRFCFFHASLLCSLRFVKVVQHNITGTKYLIRLWGKWSLTWFGFLQRIPDSFVKKFGHDLLGFVRLIVPGGHVSRIGFIKADEKLWFHVGWQQFVERFAIHIGYFLIFRYSGAQFLMFIYSIISLLR
ncbi:hypothetical protein SADUNF_Sadunf04G0097600 [Salix dunnii]|uniref:Uncharacterized protein n=1 Tax=Salix dunnii TaxID=1413687 RepID=A0A835K936_9ROSI|nr:hypothetical protein SADUNF_Sadunf04G0097600 [Salix dunnii]